MADKWLGSDSSRRRGRDRLKGQAVPGASRPRRPPDRPPDNKPGDTWYWRRVRCPECHRRRRVDTDVRMTRAGTPTSYHVCMNCGWRFAATEEIDFEADAGGTPPSD